MSSEERIIENLLYLYLRLLDNTHNYYDKTVSWQDALGRHACSFSELEQLEYAKFPLGSVNLILTKKGIDFLLSKVNIDQIVQEYLFSENPYRRILAANYINKE